MREILDKELDILNDKLILMADLVIIAIEKSIKALLNKDKELAISVIKEDEIINRREREIDNLCLSIILRQNPVASDLRLVSSILKIIRDLERIGDQAADISEISMFFKKDCGLNIIKIPQMAHLATSMVEDSIKALVDGDLDLCDKVIKRDDLVDNMFHSIKEELLIMIKDKEEISFKALDLLMIAKYLERIGDHSENIAQWVIYSITGESPKD